MNINFSQKKVLVTGGTKGIGKAIAELFHKSGADVIITGNEQKEIDELNINALNKMTYIYADFNTNDTINQFIEKLDKIGNIDICINNAGINIVNNIIDTKIDDYDLLMNVNLKSIYSICRLLGNKMITNGYGRIVNIASIWSVVTRPGRGIYTITKTGLVGLTKTLAIEMAKYNVLVNSVSPGFTLTELTKNTNTAEELKEIEEKIPAGRMADPVEIANVVLFLASEKNSYIAGQNITVDGGFVNV
jgi:3-oxoacyl-[acyl-carrier protein] reductase